jgi:hypothetical protein
MRPTPCPVVRTLLIGFPLVALNRYVERQVQDALLLLLFLAASSS